MYACENTKGRWARAGVRMALEHLTELLYLVAVLLALGPIV